MHLFVLFFPTLSLALALAPLHMVTFNEMKQDKRLIHDEIKFTQQSTVLRTSSGWHYSEECKYLQDVVILLLGLCGPPN